MHKLVKLSFLTAIFAIAMFSCKKEDPTYTVSFNSKGGTPTPQEQTVKKGNKVSKPADPTRANYSLAGWAKADNETSALWNFETETVTDDMTLFARWSLITHTVTFDSDGGSAVPAQNVSNGGRATKPTDPTRNGYEFNGWFNGDLEWNFTTAITASITLKAKWTALHIVTFDSDGGSAVVAQTIRNGNTATKPTNPTRNGYEFDGWFVGETEWNFASAITAPITLKAKWTQVHLVTFDSDGGSAVPAQTVRNGNSAIQPANPTRAIASGLYLGTLTDEFNYTFEGWYNGETEWSFATVITSPVTLKAKWSYSGSTPTRIESVLSNDVAGAFTYVNANSFGGEEYTLLIGAPNVTVGTQTLNAPNAKLTIIGIGAERTITGSSITLFTINGNNATNLTLGQNITLVRGVSSGGSPSNKLVCVLRGNLTMRDGSKIKSDANAVGAVFVSGLNSIFKMEGGEIISPPFSLMYAQYAGVYVSAGGIFEMSSMSNTTRVEVLYIDYDGIFRLSGNARIGTLFLNANNATTRTSITINGNYSGSVAWLHLGGTGISDASTIAGWWTNVRVITNGTASIANIFNNGLGDFYNSFYSVASINATHVFNSDGFLVLKEN